MTEHEKRMNAPAALQRFAAAGSATLGTEGSASAGRACTDVQRRDCYKEEAQKAIEAARRERQYNKCLRCEWSSFTGVGLYCPVPYGTCMHDRPGTEGGLEDGGCEVDQDHDGHI